MDELPLDITFNILSWLPVKKLLRLRCVSKSWCNLIDQPYLANLQTTRVKEEPVPLLLSHSRRNLSLYLVQEKDRILQHATQFPLVNLELDSFYVEGSCNGMLYFADERAVVLANPLRKDYCPLPRAIIQSPHLMSRKTYGLGFDTSTDTFKMVCVFFKERGQDLSSYSLGTIVHALGTTSWREIPQAPPYPIYGRPVFGNGVLHWIVNPFFIYKKLKGMIVSFDVKKEEFNLTPHPNFGFIDCGLFQLVDLNGDLAMADLSSDVKIEIWVMKDYDKKVWKREYRIEMRAPDGRPNNAHVEVVGVWKHGEILLRSSEGYYVYNGDTNGLRYTHSCGMKPNSTVYSHRGSLISISKFMSVS